MSEPIDSPPRAMRADILAGFLVFLIAMPLCLAIARASNFPPIAGIWTAVLGGLICTFISNSQMTIKGPAAGLIVIVAGAVVELGREFAPGATEAEQLLVGYRLTLGIGVTAGVIQIIFGLLRFGKLGEFFPLAAVHGLLAAIGIIIIANQSYSVLGVDKPKGAGPLELLAGLPSAVRQLNPEIALIGIVSLFILILLPMIRWGIARKIPAPMVVILVAVPLGMVFDLEHEHVYLFRDSFFESEHYSEYQVGPRYLVDMPDVKTNPAAAFALPDFRAVATSTGVRFIILFALIGSLESLLSAKAVDLLDPKRRKTDMNRDLLSIGVANTVSASIGGLPMISEIVRSSANINNGAQSRWANFYHGIFLLAFVVAVPNLIHRIPLAALAGMLVYTGFRLASPRSFAKTYEIGIDQLASFVGTIIVTLATDLLIGIGAGVLIKLLFHFWNGMPIRGSVRPAVEVEQATDGPITLTIWHSAVFTNWIGLKSAIDRVMSHRGVRLDLSRTKLVDHSVLEKLHELQHECEARGWTFEIVGLDDHRPVSPHPRSAHKKNKTIVTGSTPTNHVES